MRWALRSGLVISMLLVVGVAAPASAACHIFTVSVDASEVEEGQTVTVTVTRDAAVAPSSVDVSTVDETAVAGEDYEPLAETADFPDGGTSQTFTITTFDLDEVRGDRTFRVELTNPDGCAVNPNYVVGDPAQVTIVDTDAPAPTPDPTPDPTDDVTDPEPDETPTVDAVDDMAATGSATPWVVAGLALLLLVALLGNRLRSRPS